MFLEQSFLTRNVHFCLRTPTVCFYFYRRKNTIDIGDSLQVSKGYVLPKFQRKMLHLPVQFLLKQADSKIIRIKFRAGCRTGCRLSGGQEGNWRCTKVWGSKQGGGPCQENWERERQPYRCTFPSLSLLPPYQYAVWSERLTGRSGIKRTKKILRTGFYSSMSK